LVGRAGRRSAALRRLDDLGKRAGVAHSEVGEDLAIQLDVGALQALDEPAVGKAVRADRGVDAHDPQAAHVALALLPVTRGVGQRVEERLARWLDQPRTGALAALGVLEEPL